MSIIVRYEGLEFVCATAREAVEVGTLLKIQELAASGSKPAATAAAAASIALAQRAESCDEYEHAPTSSPGRLMLLLTMLANNPAGIANDDLILRLSFKSTKSLGPFTAYMRHQLGSMGIDPDEVTHRERMPGGEVRWFAGPKVAEAIEKLQATEPSLFGGE